MALGGDVVGYQPAVDKESKSVKITAAETGLDEALERTARNATDRCIAIMGHVGVGNLGDESITSAVVARLRERAPTARLIAFSLNPRDTQQRYGIPSYPIRMYTERLLSEPPPDFSWDRAFAAKLSGESQPHPKKRSWIRRALSPVAQVLRTGVAAARGLAFDFRSFRRLRGVTLLMWAGSGQVSDYVDGPFGYPLVILRWCVLARLRGARVAFASSGVGPVTHPLSRFFIHIALNLSHYRAYRDPYSLQAAKDLGAPEPNKIVRDLAFSNPWLPPLGTARKASAPPVIGINPLPFFGGEYWHVLDDSVYTNYVRAHAEAAVSLLRRGYRVVLFPTNIRVDPRAIREVMRKIEVLGPEVAAKLEVETTLQTVQGLFKRLQECDLTIATRYHGVLLSLANGTPAVAVVYHEKARQVSEHMGLGRWTIDAPDATGDRLATLAEDLLSHAAQVRESLEQRRQIDVAPLLEQFDTLNELSGPAARFRRRHELG